MAPLASPLLAARGVGLRRQTEADYPFLEALFIVNRWQEFAQAPWSDEQRRAFLGQQHHFQYIHYDRHYAGACFEILERAGRPLGRLARYDSGREVRVIDVAVIPSERGVGLGTAVMRAVLDDAGVRRRRVSLHVELFNPARRLYDRLGFTEHSCDGVNACLEWLP